MIPILMCHRSMENVAQGVVESGAHVCMNEISWSHFRDGYPKVFITDIASAEERDVYFLAAFETPVSIFEQLSVIYAMPKYLARRIVVILPYFPTGTMDRIDEEGQIATAMTLVRMLQATPVGTGGAGIPPQFVIFDIHALQERFYFDDASHVRLETAIPLVLDRIESLNNVKIVFPDEGAYKRFGGQFTAYDDTIICEKRRVGKRRVVNIKEGAPRGCHCIVIDDLVQSGGTLLACKNVLFENGADEVSGYVTHAVFPRGSWRKFLDAGFTHFWLTDSCPKIASLIDGQGPFEVLSLSTRIALFINEHQKRVHG